MKTQIEKAEVFRARHASGTFVIPNPWDKGSARLLEGLGFQALATTSAGYAFSLGQRDNSIDRDTMLEHIAVLSAATSLPLSCDLENGFGDAPETVAETIRLAAAAGAVGGSIEDASGDTSTPIYDLAAAVDRIAAAAAAARALPHPFVLTARAENFLFGRADLSDTILRLQAYQQAGADALYAPGLKSEEDIATVIRSVDRPVNVLAGLPDMRLGVSDLAALGVRPHQRRQRSCPRSLRCAPQGGSGDPGKRQLRFHQGRGKLPGPQQTPFRNELRRCNNEARRPPLLFHRCCLDTCARLIWQAAWPGGPEPVLPVAEPQRRTPCCSR